MKSIRVVSLTLALICSPFLTSCSDENKTRQNESAEVQAIEDLLQIVQTVEHDMAQGFLLKSATERDRLKLKENIYDLKIATYRLRNDPYDSSALSQLYQAFTVYAQLNLLEDDRARLGGLDLQLRTTLDAVAQLQGKSLDGIERALFTKDFNYELAPFSATKVWRIDGTKDKKYVIGDGKITAWLLSPRLNLAQVGNPGFVVDQAINDRGLPFLDGVMFQVSQDYVSGDPENATWESIKIESMPDGSSYNYRKSEVVSLKAYAGKTIVIGFKLDGEKLKFMPANAKSAWQISSFNLVGTGKVSYEALSLVGTGGGTGETAPASANDLPLPYVKSFQRTAFDSYTIPGQKQSGWTIYKYMPSNDSCCAKVAGSNMTSWLLSPRYDLSKIQNPQFFFRQAINKAPMDATVINVLITADDSVDDLSKVKWDKVKFTKEPSYTGKFTFENTENVDLSRYAGKKIVIAFKYQMPVSDIFPTWEIDSLQILGNGTLSYAPISVRTTGDVTAPVTPPTPPTPGDNSSKQDLALPFVKSFKATGFDAFLVNTKGVAGWNLYTIPNKTEACCVKVGGSDLTSWLVSPSFDLSKIENPKFWFRHVMNKAPATDGIISVMISTDENITDLTTANWEKLIFTVPPTYSPKYVFENSEVFDLSRFAGKKIVIAFKYQTPVADTYTTWEIDSLQIEGTGTLSYKPVVLAPVVATPVMTVEPGVPQ